MAGLLHALFLVLGYALVTAAPPLWSAFPAHLPKELVLVYVAAATAGTVAACVALVLSEVQRDQLKDELATERKRHARAHESDQRLIEVHRGRSQALTAIYAWHAQGDPTAPLEVDRHKLDHLRRYREHIDGLVKRAEAEALKG